MQPLDEETKDKVIAEFKELDENNEVNNRYHYLRGVYDQAGEEYNSEDLLVTSSLSVLCSAIASHTTQDASKLFNSTAQDESTATYLADLLATAINS